MCFCVLMCVFFFKQKTAYEMRISDWSSDVCSSDLLCHLEEFVAAGTALAHHHQAVGHGDEIAGLCVGVAVAGDLAASMGIAERMAEGGLHALHMGAELRCHDAVMPRQFKGGIRHTAGAAARLTKVDTDENHSRPGQFG